MSREGTPQSGGAPAAGFGPLEEEEARWLIRRALEEDLPEGDLTSDALFPGGENPPARVEAVAKEPCVACGLPVVALIYAALDPRVEVAPRLSDGARIEPGERVLELAGPAASLLRGERIALNFLQRLSGIATTTARWVARLEGLRTELLDTRKTTPGWRRLEKYAVRAGGARNHRPSLSRGVLLKDNHARILGLSGRGDPAAWVAALRRRAPGELIEIEVGSRDEFLAVRAAGADAILCDNFSVEELRWAVETNCRLQGKRPLLEASGGIGLESLREVAETGVDRISAGALTHSSGIADMSFEVIELSEAEEG